MITPCSRPWFDSAHHDNFIDHPFFQLAQTISKKNLEEIQKIIDLVKIYWFFRTNCLMKIYKYNLPIESAKEPIYFM